MTALSDALTAAQRSALAALEKAYVAGALEKEELTRQISLVGLTDTVDGAFLIAALDVLKEWGVSAPNLTERLARENGAEKMSAKQRDYLTKLAAEKGVHLRPGFEGPRFAEEPCFDCEGAGCETCNDTGRLYTPEAIRLQLEAEESDDNA